MVRELFVMAREAAPTIIFMDEVDSIGSNRGDGGGDSEVQRTMMELLNQLDGFEPTQVSERERRRRGPFCATHYPQPPPPLFLMTHTNSPPSPPLSPPRAPVDH